MSTMTHLPPGTQPAPPPPEWQVLQRQLERYAEDFAALVADYDALRSDYDALHLAQADEAGTAARQAAANPATLISHLLRNTHNATIITDPGGVIVGTNAAFNRMSGYAEEDLLGKPASVLASGRHDTGFFDRLWRALATDDQWNGEIWNRRKNGEIFPEWMHISAVRDDRRQLCNYVAIFTDMSAMKRVEERIRRLAHHDTLTGLPNRALLADRLEQALASVRRSGERLGIMFLDLDRFKHVNDTLGHDVGDKLLIDFGRRLSAQVRSADTVARLGGDEFVILLPRLAGKDDIDRVAAKIFAALEEPAVVNGHELPVITSIGAALFPDHGRSAEELMRNADTAMYHAKRLGGNRVHMFSEELDAGRRAARAMEDDLRQAAALGQFVLLYQPQYNRTRERIDTVEALLRWHRPGHGQLGPGEFLGLAEKSGMIVSIGYWVLQAACAQQVAWRDAGLTPVRMAVNVSPRQLAEPEFALRAERIIASTGIHPADLTLEVTESDLMAGRMPALDHLNRLRHLGVRITIDDFGTGYTSLARLRSLPVDAVKLDPCFIKQLDITPRGRQVAVAILAMARSMGLETVAEGVETESQWQTLAEDLCDQLQGYRFAAPQDARHLAGLLAATNAPLETET